MKFDTHEAISAVRLRGEDRESLASHFVSLGREDRRLRFGTGISDEGIRAYVRGIDFERDSIFAVQDEDLALLAVVHIACGRGPAELGLSVLAGYRGKGLGDALFRRAVTSLRNRGIRTVFVHCLAENAAMMHLARKHGMQVVHAAGESDARLELPPATVDSFVDEWLQDQRALAVQGLRRNALAARSFWNALAPSARP